MTSQRTLVLEKTATRPKRNRSGQLVNANRKFGEIPRTDLKYDDFVPLYQLWLGYFRKLVGDPSSLADERLLSADYHGCLLIVTDAKNRCQIGINGIVVRETKNTFELITKQNLMKIIPKQGSTFCFVLDRRVFTIFGDGFMKTAVQRVQKKKRSISLPYLLR